ncbi:MAG: two-component regulator propeller domain-containing protein [Paludibacter sp.]|nr:two-component regulator propeller domain-containing protein [Paludibacter sp.]
MKKYTRLIMLIWMAFAVQLMWGGTLSFRHYTVEDGLSYNTVSSIIQDRHGFMWIGTENGLNRFDGYSFREYRSARTGKNAMITNLITSLLEDASGTIWIGTDVGIYTFNPSKEEFEHFTMKAADGSVINTTINNIVSDRLGCMWISTYGQGVFSYNPRSKRLDQYNVLIEGMSSNRFDQVNQVYVDKNNNVWAASKAPENPLLRFDRRSGSFRSFPVQHKNFTVYKFFEDSQHNFWLGTWSRGICKLNTNTGEVVSYLSADAPGGILHIHEINEYKPGMLLIGSDDGLSLFNINTLSHQLFRPNESDPASISDKFIYPIFKDHEGGFWIGTYFGGLNYLSTNSGLFGRYSHSRYANSVSGNVVGRFAEDKRGNIWIATDDGGLNVLNTATGTFSAYLPGTGSNSLSYHNVHALCWDDDLLWIGTYSGGLNVLNTKTGKFKLYNSTDKNPRTLDGGSIYAIFKDNANRIWVTSMSGVNLYNRTTDDFTRIKKFDVTTIDIRQDKKGFIWFATQGKGIYRLDPLSGKWKNYSSANTEAGSIPNNQINCIAFDQTNTMWIGTANGLCQYNANTDKFSTVDINIPSRVICSIIPVGNNLWLTTSKGLIRYNVADKSFQIFTRSDGLMSDQFIVNSGFQSSNGTIYIGTACGFNAFNPAHLNQNTHIPSVAITGLEIFNKEVEVSEDGPLKMAIGNSKEINLTYKDNVFSLSFVALSYVTPEKNKYAYKLDGFDHDWNVVSLQHKVTYTNLPAGEYTFRVKAANNDGCWNNEGTQIKIIIHPPFWLTIWFKILYFILFVFAAVMLVRYLKHRTEQRHNEEIKELSQQKEKEIYNAKIQFFTMVAHEIRTPVSLIIGPLEKILTNNALFPQAVNNDLNIIERNSQRLLQLVNQLLDFRKVEQGSLVLNPSAQHIYSLLNNVCERFIPIFEQNHIRFSFLCPDMHFQAEVDPEAITKSVSNLLTNALKYTRDSIKLTCRKSDIDNTFEICVQDNGNGIADSEKEKVFDPFYQIPGSSKQGTGIGLSLVKSIVEGHKGKVTVSDSPNSGATFCLVLPLTSDISRSDEGEPAINFSPEHDILPEVEPPPIQSPEKLKQTPALLIVEDNDDMRNFLADNFRDEYSVFTANNGLEGLACLKNTEVNLIISDLMMPEMDGLEFCQAVRSNYLYSHIPFVLLTAKTDLDTKIEGLNFGADSYIEKPFSIHYLKAQINNLIESRRMLRKKYSQMPVTPITTIAGNASDELFLTKMNEIIEKNISNEAFSIDQLAEELFISRSGLFSKIKMLAGITPNELIQLVRLKKAAAYISQHDYRINEIAYLVGFNNPSYFSKCFQKQFGMTPKEFENHQKQTLK